MHIHPQRITNINLVFEAESDFLKITYDEGDNWHFAFANEINVYVEGGFWRILQEGKILLTSYDHKQQFGLPEPIDLVEEMKRILSSIRLLKIKVDETGDLKLLLSNNHTLEIFITSSGYESYQFSFNGKRYIGMGSGEISVYNIT